MISSNPSNTRVMSLFSLERQALECHHFPKLCGKLCLNTGIPEPKAGCPRCAPALGHLTLRNVLKWTERAVRMGTQLDELSSCSLVIGENRRVVL